LSFLLYFPSPSGIAYAADSAEITIHTIPDSADVFVDGISRGKTPVLLVLPVNASVEIKLEHAEQKPYILTYEVKKDDTIIIDLTSGEQLDEREYWHRVARKTVIDIPTETPTPVVRKDHAGAKPDIKVSTPTVLEIPKPGAVPDALISERISGSAVYQARINHRGQVLEVHPVQASVSKPLDEFIVKWIAKWRFSPAEANGFPVPADKQITIYYDLHKGLLKIQDFPEPDEFSASVEPSASETPNPVSPKAEATPVPTIKTTELPVVETSSEPTPEPTATATRIPEPVTPASPPSDVKESSAVDQKPKILQRPVIGAIPIEIQKLKLKGTAVFELLIKTDGKVSDVFVIESTGSEKLDDWLKPILKATEWEPAILDGQTVSCRRRLSVSFYTLACRFDFPDIYD